MTIKSWSATPPSLDLSEIQTEFGGATPISLSEYYSGGLYVSPGTVGFPGGVSTTIPTGGTISVANFYGSAIITGTSFTDGYDTFVSLPNAQTWLSFKMIGGGGGTGGSDGYLGGNGGGGNYLEGTVLLPQGPKGVSLIPGRPGANGPSGQYVSGGTGGGGAATYDASTNTYLNTQGGDGAASWGAGASGSGGGGGGGSAIWLSNYTGNLRIIAAAGGGGGAGGAGLRGPGTDRNGNAVVQSGGGRQFGQRTNISSSNFYNGELGQGPNNSPTTSPPYYFPGIYAVDGGGGGGGGGPAGFGGELSVEVAYNPPNKDGSGGGEFTQVRHDSSAGSGQSGAVLINQFGTNPFTWHTISALFASSASSLLGPDSPGQGGFYANNSNYKASGGGVSIAWTTQVTAPTNGVGLVPFIRNTPWSMYNW
jgi:hypothetical protein